LLVMRVGGLVRTDAGKKGLLGGTVTATVATIVFPYPKTPAFKLVSSSGFLEMEPSLCSGLSGAGHGL
jgi:hypothetical protein